MSGLFKGIGKVFKKIVKVVKKVALPALAIGAIALTGGAALGVLPSVGSVIGGLGLGPLATGALTTAAQGATFGAVGSALMGKDPLKGAVTGMGIGAGLGVAGGLAGATGVAGATGAAGGAGQAAQVAGDLSPITVGADAQAAMSSIPAASAVGTAASAPAAIASTGSVLGGIGNFVQKNPLLVGSLMQGIGSGIMAKQAAKEDQRAYDSTLGYTGLGGEAATMSDPGYLAYDPSSGKIVKKGA